jgi:hypothetical protein
VQPIIVSNLRVESVTGPTCYAGENGFSALTAYVKSDDPAIVNQLRKAGEEGTTVTIKCATLEIEGRVGNLLVTTDGLKDAIAVSVDELRYFQPNRKS